jgi:hypothetical protein
LGLIKVPNADSGSGVLKTDYSKVFYDGIDPRISPIAVVNNQIQLPLRSQTQNRVEPVHFFEAGTYLVVCVNPEHFEAGMYAYVTVEPPHNHAPIPNHDEAATTAGVSVTINVLANDSDPDLDPLAVTLIENPVGGTAVINADNTVTFTTAADFTGGASFWYTVSDGKGGTASAIVNVWVAAA